MFVLSFKWFLSLFVEWFLSTSQAVEGSVSWKTWQRKRKCYGGEEKCKISPYTFPSVPFFSLAALTVVPSGCWPSFRGGIRSFIRSRPRASSKLRIFRVGEKPWMANGGKKEIKENEVVRKMCMRIIDNFKCLVKTLFHETINKLCKHTQHLWSFAVIKKPIHPIN